MKPSIARISPALQPHRITKALLRLCAALGLYLCFGLLSEHAYANNQTAGPLDSTHGSVWLLPENGSYFNALLLQTEVDFNVAGMIARATVKQRFKNTGRFWAEGIYVFPLPENAAIDHFRLRLGERLIEGRIQERTEAKRAYESARNEGRQAGLIEQQRANVFTTSLANIAPGEEISVEIEYQQTLEYRDGCYRLRFPLVVGPRFHAARQQLPSLDDDTDVATAVAATSVNPVNIQVTLDAGVPLAELVSSYHAIEIRQSERHRYSVTLAKAGTFADRDFELVWRPIASERPQAAVFTERHQGYDYVLLSVMPPDLQALGQQLLPRDLIFVLDVSGSMSGTSIEQAKASLIQALDRLKPEERFNIIWFNDRTERLYPQAMAASADNVAYARLIIDSLEADGGTVMLPALALALGEQPEPFRVRQIIFLTDGNVDNEQELFAVIAKQLGDNRLFTIGIGSAPNSYFMRKAARAGRGTFTHIGDSDEVQAKTGKLLRKLEAPALVDITMNVQGLDIQAFPQPIPDLYLGEPVSVLLRGRQIGSSLTLHGEYGSSAWRQTVELSGANDHRGIRTVWARSKIAYLLEQHHDAQRDQRDAFRAEIIQTAIDHHLVSRFTSMVAVDVTPLNSTGQVYSEKLKTGLPHGWKRGRAGLARGHQLLTAQLTLPQTATNARLHLMIAGMLFALAMVFYLWRKML